jgi:hypothetical protein
MLQQRDPVAAYKDMLAEILDKRPSGTRRRLAATLGKNRSFVSQITSSAYATPIPSSHLDVIFEVCHFSEEQKRQFLKLYTRAHPGNRQAAAEVRLKPLTIYLPDLGDESRNAKLQSLLAGFVRQLAPLIAEQPKPRRRK